MNQPLQEWMNANAPGEQYFAAMSWWRMCFFARDTLRFLLQAKPVVVSTHTSKSVLCPVFQFDTDWAVITMRDNFYDWNVSVQSKVGPLAEVPGAESYGARCFFQGMEEWRQLPMALDRMESFSFCVANDYGLYAALWFWRMSWIQTVSS